MKRGFLIWIIAILAVLNIAIIATFLFQRSQCNRPPFRNIEKIEIPDSRLGRFFRDELDLNPEQHDAFRGCRQKFHQGAGDLTMQMQDKRKEMMLELQKENPDREALDLIAKELGDLHEQLKRETFEYYLNIKEHCNKEQQERLFTIFYNISNTGTDVVMPCKRRNN